MRRFFFILICIFSAVSFLFSQNIAAQTQLEGTTVLQDTDVVKTNAGFDSNFEYFTMSPENGRIAKYTMTAIIPPITFLFGVKAWEWGDSHSFFSKSEGWFGQGTSFGGADKLGHFYAHYVVERFFNTLYGGFGCNKTEKLYYSVGMAATVGFIIECGDGFSSQYGFSFEDLAVDYAGVLLGGLLDYSPTLDSFIGISMHYVPTSAFKNYDEGWKKPLTFVNDYSGQIVMMNFKLAGFKYIGMKTPEFLRYIQFDLGFYTKNYSYYDVHQENPNPDKTRHAYFGISINFAEVVKDMYENDNSRACRISQVPFKYYAVDAGFSKSHQFSK